MKTLRNFLGAAFAAFALNSVAVAVELSAATNQQILDELSRRLGGGSSGGSAIVSYTCSSYVLNIETLGNQTASHQVNTNSSSDCTQQATELNHLRSRIDRTVFAAVCSSYVLHRLGLRPDGTMTVSQINTNSSSDCRSQAEAINRG